MRESYFGMIENKYSCKVSLNKPIIIRLDGKGVCKNSAINMYNESIGGFAYALQITAREISKRYYSLVLISSDEISIIFLDNNVFYNKFNSCKCQKSSSLITQDISLLFNNHYNGNFIYFDARTFNIPEDKTLNYITFRTKSAKNVSIHYIAKKYIPFTERKGKKLSEIEHILKEHHSNHFNINDYHLYGKAYFNGKEVDIKKLLNCVEINSLNIENCYKYNNNNINTIYDNDINIDILDFDDVDDI